MQRRSCGPARALALRGRLLIGISLVPGVLAACTFERRPDAQRPEGPSATPSDSVNAVVTALGEALDRGDLAAALTLFSSDARITSLEPPIEGAEAPPWRPAGDVLQAEVGGPAHAPLEILESIVSFPSEGTAVVLNRYVDMDAWAGEPAALESVVLAREDGEWRIRNLHRSFSPRAVSLPDSTSPPG